MNENIGGLVSKNDVPLNNSIKSSSKLKTFEIWRCFHVVLNRMVHEILSVEGTDYL